MRRNGSDTWTTVQEAAANIQGSARPQFAQEMLMEGAAGSWYWIPPGEGIDTHAYSGSDMVYYLRCGQLPSSAFLCRSTAQNDIPERSLFKTIGELTDDYIHRKIPNKQKAAAVQVRMLVATSLAVRISMGRRSLNYIDAAMCANPHQILGQNKDKRHHHVWVVQLENYPHHGNSLMVIRRLQTQFFVSRLGDNCQTSCVLMIPCQVDATTSKNDPTVSTDDCSAVETRENQATDMTPQQDGTVTQVPKPNSADTAGNTPTFGELQRRYRANVFKDVSREWYILVNDAVHGPYTCTQLLGWSQKEGLSIQYKLASTPIGGRQPVEFTDLMELLLDAHRAETSARSQEQANSTNQGFANENSVRCT